MEGLNGRTCIDQGQSTGSRNFLFLADHLPTGQHGEILQHGLAPIAEAQQRRLFGQPRALVRPRRRERATP